MTEYEDDPSIRVYTDAEIEIFLAGDRRAIDRLLMQGMNSIISVIIPHIKRENIIISALGTEADVEARVDWINLQIERQRTKTHMMAKVSESAITWAAIAFIGFVIFSIWEYVMTLIRIKQGISK